MKTRKALIIVIVLAVLTGIAAIMHLSTREKVAEGSVQIAYNDETYSLNQEELDYVQVSGVRVNGKGEEKPVEGQGILLKDILAEYEITEYENVTIISDDSYSAEVSFAEVSEDGKVYLMYEEEELRLIVFGDVNSKRSVSNVVQIVVE